MSKDCYPVVFLGVIADGDKEKFCRRLLSLYRVSASVLYRNEKKVYSGGGGLVEESIGRS